MPSTSDSDYLVYTAKAGDTWDLISYYHYGYSERYASLLMRANIRLVDVVMFEGGEEITVPIINTVKTPETLPPWRRNAT